MKVRATEIDRQHHETRRAITFREMCQKVAETRLEPDSYAALLAETVQRLAQVHRNTKVIRAVGPTQLRNLRLRDEEVVKSLSWKLTAKEEADAIKRHQEAASILDQVDGFLLDTGRD